MKQITVLLVVIGLLAGCGKDSRTEATKAENRNSPESKSAMDKAFGDLDRSRIKKNSK